MKDIFGNDLEIGDEVAFNQPYYKNLIRGTVVKVNPKMIRIEYKLNGRVEVTSEYARDTVKNLKK